MDLVPSPAQTYAFYPRDGIAGLPPEQQTDDYHGIKRAGVAPFLAAKLLGTDSWKWMLYGDDGGYTG